MCKDSLQVEHPETARNEVEYEPTSNETLPDLSQQRAAVVTKESTHYYQHDYYYYCFYYYYYNFYCYHY